MSTVVLVDIWRGWRARQWSITTGRVIEAGVSYHKGRGHSYLPAVRFRYAVDGQEFVSERFRFGGRTLRSDQASRKALGTLAVGADVPIRYDPQRPSEAVIHAGIDSTDLLWLALGLAVLAFGLAQASIAARAA